jgi:DNA-dependent RNA polymerase auxiliary subunit epsilon
MSNYSHKALLPTEIADVEQFQKLVSLLLKRGTKNKQEIFIGADITAMTLEKIINEDAEELYINPKTRSKIRKYVAENKKLVTDNNINKIQKVTQAELDKSCEDAKKLLNLQPRNGIDFWVEFGKLTKSIPDNIEITITVRK